MTYCKNYCEEERISTSKLNEAQKTLYYIAENMKMDKSISEEGYKHFQLAIKALKQEPTLDKIRDEIEEASNRCNNAIAKGCYLFCLGVINKYIKREVSVGRK